VTVAPRLWLGNFDFEHRLADPGSPVSPALMQINAELATSWLAIAEPGDWIWTPVPLSEAFVRSLRDAGLPEVQFVATWDAIPAGVDCRPWGWTDGVRKLCRDCGWRATAPDAHAVCMVNGRQFAAQLEQDWQVGLPGAGIARTQSEFDSLVQSIPGRWVVKANQGMSGRERILGVGTPTLAQQNWVRRRLNWGPVIVEPWVERESEIGIQIEIPQSGAPELVGIVPMHVDARGQYSGSDFAPHASLDRSWWAPAAEVVLRAAARVQQAGYFGPLGVDAMRYRTGSGTLCIRPLQDINARWTMGRLALGWRRWLGSQETGTWHLTTREVTFPPGIREFSLIPDRLGEHGVDRVSVVRFMPS